MSRSIVVIGGGFAGLWAALAAARCLDEQGVGPGEVEVTLVNRDPWHAIRVRNYEADIAAARLPLSDLLGPAGIRLAVGSATAVDVESRVVTVERAGASEGLRYDRLVLAAGSRLDRPELPGLAPHAFSIDTWDEAAQLADHLRTLAGQPASSARDTVVIVGGGLTGIELACEMPERLRSVGINGGRVILADRAARVGDGMGRDAQAVIASALEALGVECRAGLAIASVDPSGVVLATGERIEARTVVWTAGLRASPLAALLPGAKDSLGRIRVDATMRVAGLDGILAAGDIAAAPLPGNHMTVMSCQFARPMGRFAGHNAAADLLGRPLLPMHIERYVTCIDLGPWGALLTQGWDRRVAVSGAEAKQIKTTINCQRIYPPRTGSRRDLLDAAVPTVQAPPQK